MTTDQVDKIINQYIAYLDAKDWPSADRLLQMTLAISQGFITMPPIIAKQRRTDNE
jgi:hypothetical protein